VLQYFCGEQLPSVFLPLNNVHVLFDLLLTSRIRICRFISLTESIVGIVQYICRLALFTQFFSRRFQNLIGT
jgi:hypothetical protein